MQHNKIHGPCQTPYQDIHRWQQPQNFGKAPLLTTPQTRLQIEEAPKEAMCSFHMTPNHGEQDCPYWLNCVQLVKNALVAEQMPKGGELGTYFLKYESNSERGGNIFMKLQDPTCIVMTRGQRNQKCYLATTTNMSTSKGKEHIHANPTKIIEPKILSRMESMTSTLAFDIM